MLFIAIQKLGRRCCENVAEPTLTPVQPDGATAAGTRTLVCPRGYSILFTQH
jgi:hypothetical protein